MRVARAEALEASSQPLFGQRIADHFGMRARAVIACEVAGSLGLAATHLACARQARQRTAPAPPEDAFSILYQFDALENYCRWLGGRFDRAGRLAACEVDIVDLRDTPQWKFAGPFHALQFYIPFTALWDFTDSHGIPPVGRLESSIGTADCVLAGLSQALLQAHANAVSNRLLVDQLALTLLAHFAVTYGGAEADRIATRGGLAAWQERRAKEVMAARLASNLTIAQIARECRLSPSHFTRAFRKSMGQTPQRYLMQLRVEEAKRHLVRSGLPMTDVALVCGFGDQSHFTRVFRHLVGVTPGAWRRGRAGGEPAGML